MFVAQIFQIPTLYFFDDVRPRQICRVGSLTLVRTYDTHVYDSVMGPTGSGKSTVRFSENSS